MSKADLGAKVPDGINWNNTGIPTNAEAVDPTNLIDGQNDAGVRMESAQQSDISYYPTTDLGPGPQGNMFGESVHQNASNTIAESEKFITASVLERNHFQPIEAVEGFGEEPGFEAIKLERGPGVVRVK